MTHPSNKRRNKQLCHQRLTKTISNILSTGEQAESPGLEHPCRYAKGTTNASGYVLISAVGLGFKNATSAHVISWMLANNISDKNQIPKDQHGHLGRKEVHHLCSETCTTPESRRKQRSCIEPTHLILLTHNQNIARTTRTMATHCSHGHDYSLPNARNAHGACKVCIATRIRERYHNDAAFREKRQARNRVYSRKVYVPKARKSKKNLCGHKDRPHFGHNRCRSCYHKRYHKMRKNGNERNQ